MNELSQNQIVILHASCCVVIGTPPAGDADAGLATALHCPSEMAMVVFLPSLAFHGRLLEVHNIESFSVQKEHHCGGPWTWRWRHASPVVLVQCLERLFNYEYCPTKSTCRCSRLCIRRMSFSPSREETSYPSGQCVFSR